MIRYALPALAVLLAACAAGPASEPAASEPVAGMAPADASAACGVDEAEHERLMALSLADFDQDFDGGWRAVSYEEGCDRVAADLIRDYIDIHDLDPDENRVVFWHVGQLLAGAGDYPEAREYFLRSFDPEAEDFHDRAWATYAQGTVAFIDGDREGLDAAIAELSRPEHKPSPERVASMIRMSEEQNVSFPEGALEKPLNLIALEGLRRCFGQIYSQAYGQCPPGG